MSKGIEKVVIVGAGPAGVTSAVQCERFGIKPYLIDKKGIAGGLIENANMVENYPGIERPLRGKALVERIREHLNRFDIKVHKGSITEIKNNNDCYQVCGDFGSIYTQTIILAVGTLAIKLNIPGLDKIPSEKIFYDVISIPDTKEINNLLIIGGGEAAFDYALSLSRKEKKVTIAIRDSQPKAQGLLKKRVEVEANIKVLYSTIVTNLSYERNRVIASTIRDDVKDVVCVDALLSAIGRKSALSNIACDFEIKNSILTSRDGIFVIGDARLGALGQMGIAVGDGLVAASKVGELFEGYILNTRE